MVGRTASKSGTSNRNPNTLNPVIAELMVRGCDRVSNVWVGPPLQYHWKVMLPNEVVIVSAARTPIGRYGGSFRNVHPAELGATAARAAIERGGIAPDSIDEVLMGHGRQAGSGPNPARQVGRRAGLPDTVPAQTINKACASGMQAVATGAQSILLGESQVVLAGGIESMSRMPYLDRLRRRALGPQDGQLHPRRCDVSRRLHLLVERDDHG